MVENKKTEKVVEKTTTKKIKSKKNNSDTNSKTENQKKSAFFKALQNQLFEFGTLALKKGIVNLAISKIDNTEEKIKSIVDEKIKAYKNSVVKIISFIIAGLFLSYGLLEWIMRSLNYSEYTNLVFGGVFLAVALLINTEE